MWARGAQVPPTLTLPHEGGGAYWSLGRVRPYGWGPSSRSLSRQSASHSPPGYSRSRRW